MNRLVVIGCIGSKRCYLNVSREEAIRRYTEYVGYECEITDDEIEEIDFKDEFGAYDVWHYSDD